MILAGLCRQPSRQCVALAVLTTHHYSQAMSQVRCAYRVYPLLLHAPLPLADWLRGTGSRGASGRAALPGGDAAAALQGRAAGRPGPGWAHSAPPGHPLQPCGGDQVAGRSAVCPPGHHTLPACPTWLPARLPACLPAPFSQCIAWGWHCACWAACPAPFSLRGASAGKAPPPPLPL